MNPLQLCLDLVSGTWPPRARPAQTRPAPPRGPARDARFELRRSPRRRTLGLEVHPDLRVVVRAPADASAVEIESFVAERAAWIEAQIAWFRTRPARPDAETFADGMALRHLGAEYRLRLRPNAPPGIALVAGELIIGGRAAADPGRAERAYRQWQRTRATVEFGALLDRWHAHPRFARYARPALVVRAMRSRWGSLGSRRGMSLNLALIETPPDCIEYVVVHELCHLRYHGHGRGFHRLLESVLPDWRARKRELDLQFR